MAEVLVEQFPSDECNVPSNMHESVAIAADDAMHPHALAPSSKIYAWML